MTRRLAVSLLILLLLASCTATQLRAPDVAQRHVLFISLDGLKPEHYLSAKQLGITAPNLAALMRRGIWAEGVVGVFPTMTYPSHATLMTGVASAKHGIVSNRYFDPLREGGSAWYWYADDFKVPTLIGAVEATGRRTAAIAWPSTINIGAAFNVPDFWRPGSRHASDRNLLEAISSPPDILDAAGDFRGSPIGERNHWSDRERVDIARYVIERHKPALVMLHLLGTDAAQHDHGPGSSEAFRAVEEADRHIGELVSSLQRAGIADRTVIVVASDHGFLPATRALQPNTLLHDSGLIRLDGEGEVKEWRAMFHADGGSTILHLNNESDVEAVRIVRELLETRMQERGSGIRRVLSREQIASMGGSAPLALEVEDGFRALDDVSGSWFDELDAKGTHGHPPDRPEMRASLIISNVRERGSVGVIEMTRVAPTVAKLLRVSLSREAAEPLTITPE